MEDFDKFISSFVLIPILILVVWIFLFTPSNSLEKVIDKSEKELRQHPSFIKECGEVFFFRMEYKDRTYIVNNKGGIIEVDE